MVGAALLACPVAGCAGDQGEGGPAKSASPTAVTSPGAPVPDASELARVQKKLDDAESAAAAEESDAASDG